MKIAFAALTILLASASIAHAQTIFTTDRSALVIETITEDIDSGWFLANAVVDAGLRRVYACTDVWDVAGTYHT